MDGLHKLRECPKCGYTDPPYFRPAFIDIEKDVIRGEELERIDGDLMAALRKDSIQIQGPYAFHLTKSGQWVERLYLPIFKARGNSFRVYKNYDASGRGKLAGAMSKLKRRAMESLGMIPDPQQKLTE